MDYISYLDIPTKWGLSKGDVVLLTSDVVKMGYVALKNHEKFNLDSFLDRILEVIGPEGTLLIPTYNWDFCKGISFDYNKTTCKTGSLGTAALKRLDFRRTKHPIYSFAVSGKYAELLCGMNNTSSFGPDSPFSFLEMMKAKNVIIDVNLTHCFTYVHYIEERAGVSNYRYPKSFTAGYIDEDGTETTRTYSMLVRDLNDYYATEFEPLEEELNKRGIMNVIDINGVAYRIVDLFKSSEVIMDDIRNNQSRMLCKHKWQ